MVLWRFLLASVTASTRRRHHWGDAYAELTEFGSLWSRSSGLDVLRSSFLNVGFKLS
jgi:hypothetical protein